MDILQPMFGMIALTAVVTPLLYGSRMLLIYRVTTSGGDLAQAKHEMRLARIYLGRSAISRITTTIYSSSRRSLCGGGLYFLGRAHGQYPRHACLDVRRIQSGAQSCAGNE